VVRNKLRRRLAAILNETLAYGRTIRLVVVARPLAADLAYGALQAEVASALRRA
jgi:ribonuclease P protein component